MRTYYRWIAMYGALLIHFATFLGSDLLAQPLLSLVSQVDNGTVTVRAMLDDPEAPVPVFQGTWRSVPGGAATFQLQRTSAPSNDIHVMLDRAVEAGLAAYIDAHITYTKTGITTDIPVTSMALNMNAMIAAAVEELAVKEPIAGITEPTVAQLLRFATMDWTNNSSLNALGSSEDKYMAIYHVMKAQRTELDRQLRADLMPLGNVLIWGDDDGADRKAYRIASTCGTVFDEENFLCALDLKLATNDLAMADPAIGLTALKAFNPPAKLKVDPIDTLQALENTFKVRKRDRWLKTELDMINIRLDELDQRRELWQLRDRLEDIEDRIVGLELEVRDKIKAPAPEKENPLARLSELSGKNLSVSFERNSATLEREHHLLLNEVFEQLARTVEDRVLITGYTDASGPPMLNLRLSEQRAKAVRNYLLQRGIAPERLMVNYYGDSRSSGRAPDERRVEIEWLAR